MLKEILARLAPQQKGQLRALDRKARQFFVRKFRSFGKPQLITTLRALGVERGDALMVHSSFHGAPGFTGSPSLFIEALLEVVGSEGHLLMVSLPYLSSTYDYLREGKLFDARKTISHAGILSEAFRRRSGVLRSQHPTHPVLALGPKANWLLADHEKCLYPCGLGTPFDQFQQLGGKVLLFNVTTYAFSFCHFLEERVKDQLKFPLFLPEPFEVPYIDFEGKRQVMRTYVYSLDAIRRRRFQILTDELHKQNLIKARRLGNSHLQLIGTKDLIRCLDEMTKRGIFFYE